MQVVSRLESVWKWRLAERTVRQRSGTESRAKERGFGGLGGHKARDDSALIVRRLLQPDDAASVAIGLTGQAINAG